jgi:predicted flap endonuclease-1-like 5' DNA nuclease
VAKLTDIRGIDDATAEKLRGAGATTSEKLLELGAAPAGRRKLAGDAGVDAKDLLEWVNRADLARVNGVAGVYADLLENAGVDTVKELGTRRADNLFQAISDINAAQSLTKRLPTQADVESWVAQAKQLGGVVTY